MASACVNNIAENFSAAPYPSHGWLSPRISFSRRERNKSSNESEQQSPPPANLEAEIQDPENSGGGCDFEFRLDDPVAMLPADELFSDGKLMPLHFSANPKPSSTVEIRSPERAKVGVVMEMGISGTDPHLFSPKAPRCSSRWRELLGLKKLYQNASKTEQNHQQHKSNLIKHLLHRAGNKGFSCSSSSSPSSLSSSNDSSFNLPLLKDCDCESVSVSSSRLSLSSSSSGHEHEELARLCLDSDKTTTATTTTHLTLNTNPSPNPFVLNRNPQPRIRRVKAKSGSESGNHSSGGARVGRSPIRREQAAPPSRGVSVDSPRMNSSGKIVFQSLERSSSSPSSFHGGPRFKHRGMERSYSANVRVTPVLNVPVCSLRGSSKSGSVFGFGQLFSSPQKRESSSNEGGSSGIASGSGSTSRG